MCEYLSTKAAKKEEGAGVSFFVFRRVLTTRLDLTRRRPGNSTASYFKSLGLLPPDATNWLILIHLRHILFVLLLCYVPSVPFSFTSNLIPGEETLAFCS